MLCAGLAWGFEDGLELGFGEANLLQVPTTAEEAEALAEAGAGDPGVVVVALALPEGFDAARPAPILFTSVTGDPYQSNVKELEMYREPALARGWVVLTAQVHPWPDREQDTIDGRRLAARVAFRALEGLFPGSREWPTAFAGFSGGSKMAQLLAGDALAQGRQVCGVLMGGCNEDQSRRIRRLFHPPEEALWAVPYFLSSGDVDRIATPRQMRKVGRSLENKGARHVRLEVYAGPHRFHRPHVAVALAWFEERLAAD